MKAWLLRWLGVTSLATQCERLRVAHVLTGNNIESLKEEIELIRRAGVRHHDEHEAALAELIQELNALRNSIPVALAQNVKPPVRVFRNFREFRMVIEHAPLERKS